MTLSTFANEYAQGRSPASYKAADLATRSLIDFAGDLPLRGYTAALARSYADALPSQRKDGDEPLSLFTQWNRLRTLFTLFKAAQMKGLVKANPFAGLVPSQPEAAEKWLYLSVDDARKLIAACDWQMGLYIALARFGGLRRNEIARATLDDVMGEPHRLLRVRAAQGVRTTKQKNRTVPIVPDLWDMIEVNRPTIAASESKLLAPIKGCPFLMLRAAHAKAGVQESAQAIHRLRKSCASDFYSQNIPLMDVSAWMGHTIEVAAAAYYKTQTANTRRLTHPTEK